GLKQTPDTFFNDAKNNREGAAASRLAISQLFSAGLDVQTDPTVASAFNLQKASFASDQARFLAAQRRLDFKNSLLDSPAQTQHHAAIGAEVNEPDPVKRAQMKADADKQLAQSLTSNPNLTAPKPPVADASGGNTPQVAGNVAPQPSDLIAANDKLSQLT